MMLVGLLLLTIVLLNSLFTGDQGARQIAPHKVPLVSLIISEMQVGQIRKTRWNSKEVAVLLRQFPDRLVQKPSNVSIEKLHASMKVMSRSKKADYFVYFNLGDSKNCPLFYAGGVFKDVCSANKFDEAGRNIDLNPQGYRLQIPPHYFKQQQLIFGQWQP